MVQDLINREEQLLNRIYELEDFIENGSIPLHRVDGNGIILWANQAELDSLGYTAEEYIGQPISKFHASEETINDILKRLVNKETLNNYEAVLKCKNGSYKTVLINSNVLFKNGEFVHTRCFTRDISEMKKMQAESTKLINDQRQNLENFFMEIPAAVCVLKGKDHVFEMANPLYREITGKRDVIGRSIRDVFPEVNDQGFFEILDKVYETGEPYTGKEVPLAIDKDGSMEVSYINFTYRASRDIDGKIDGVLAFVIDVTDMVRARKQVEHNAEYLKDVLESIPQKAWTTNAEGVLIFLNKRWMDYTGQDQNADKNEAWNFIHPEDSERSHELFNLSINEGGPYEVEQRVRDKNGHYRWHLTRGNPVKDNTGKITGWVGTNTDIDDQKKVEQMKGDFIGIASHELKTPLTSLKSYLQLLERSFNDNSLGNAAIYIHKANIFTNKLHKLIGELLDVSKVQNGKLQLNISEFDFDEMLNEAIESVQHTSPNHHISRQGEINQLLTADKERIQQVIINMLTNAVKYSPNADKVHVRIESADNKVQVSVKDYGIGIPTHNITQLFDRFYRVEANEMNFQGLGLGLYISADIIKKHGGKMWVESKVDEGSTFYFQIPLNKK